MNKRVLSRPLGRCVGLDVHLDFIEIAICEEGKVFVGRPRPVDPGGDQDAGGEFVADRSGRAGGDG